MLLILGIFWQIIGLFLILYIVELIFLVVLVIIGAFNLSYMGLGGTIPPHLGNLSFSVYLNFRQNNFHGHLPNELCQLHRLKIISLAYNKLSGSFPLWISIFSKFQILSLRNNSLIGPIPDSLFNFSKLDESSTYQSWRSWTPGSIILMEIFLQRLQIWVCLRFWIWETTTYKVHIPRFPLLHIICFYLNLVLYPIVNSQIDLIKLQNCFDCNF